jgi:hypothetical protein
LARTNAFLINFLGFWDLFARARNQDGCEKQDISCNTIGSSVYQTDSWSPENKLFELIILFLICSSREHQPNLLSLLMNRDLWWAATRWAVVLESISLANEYFGSLIRWLLQAFAASHKLCILWRFFYVCFHILIRFAFPSSVLSWLWFSEKEQWRAMRKHLPKKFRYLHQTLAGSFTYWYYSKGFSLTLVMFPVKII